MTPEWKDFGVALSLFLVFEGILPFLNPMGLRAAMRAMSELSDVQLRIGGLISMISGLALLYFVRQ